MTTEHFQVNSCKGLIFVLVKVLFSFHKKHGHPVKNMIYKEYLI